MIGYVIMYSAHYGDNDIEEVHLTEEKAKYRLIELQEEADSTLTYWITKHQVIE